MFLNSWIPKVSNSCIYKYPDSQITEVFKLPNSRTTRTSEFVDYWTPKFQNFQIAKFLKLCTSEFAVETDAQTSKYSVFLDSCVSKLLSIHMHLWICEFVDSKRSEIRTFSNKGTACMHIYRQIFGKRAIFGLRLSHEHAEITKTRRRHFGGWSMQSRNLHGVVETF